MNFLSNLAEGFFFVLIISFDNGSGSFSTVEHKRFETERDCIFARDIIKMMGNNVQAQCFAFSYRKVEEPKK